MPKKTEALTARLVDGAHMSAALEELIAKLVRYTVIIRRPGFNWQSGARQDTQVVLFEGDKLIDNGTITTAATRAREVIIIATSKDRGVASINLTSRQVRYIANAADLRTFVEEFNRQLLKGVKSWWFTPGAAVLLSVTPLLVLFTIYAIDITINPSAGHGVNFHPDQWAVVLGRVVFFAWPALVALAMFIAGVRSAAGPFLIWPRKLNALSALQMLYRMRNSQTLRQNVYNLLVAVVAGIVLALFSKAF